MNFYDLPVYKQKDRILKALDSHGVVVVESPTGSGKTTQLPLILHEAGYTAKGIVGITQPRRIATLSVSEFIAKQLKVDNGSFIGYKMRFEDKTSDSTRIKIMTDGTLLQEMKTDPLLSRYSVMMVDEAHERSLNIDFILGLLKDVVSKRSDFKIIISSATINAEVFSKYFDNAPIVRIETQPYPVITLYDPPSGADEEALINKVVEIIERVVTREKRGGDILVFLPGERLIKSCMDKIGLSDAKRKLRPIPLYGMLGKEEQERVFDKPPMGKTKVVISTNIAETSITIDGVATVIDSGKHKENVYSGRTFTSGLVEGMVSKASANQRRGRAGRTGPGYCYRLYSKNDFDNFAEFTTEEIYRTDLSEVVLRMASLGITGYDGFDFISKPAKSGIDAGVETLKTLDALDENGAITSIGKSMIRLPLLPRHARILVEAMLRYPGVTVECAIITAFLSSNSPYLFPRGEETEAREAQKAYQDKKGDFGSYIMLFNAYLAAENREKFCEKAYLDKRTMDELVNVEKQLEENIHEMGGLIEAGGPVADYLCACAKGLIQFVCIRTGRDSYRSLTAERIMIHPGSALFKESPKYIIAGEIVRTSRMYARSVSAPDRTILERVDPNLVEKLHAFEKNGEKRTGFLEKKRAAESAVRSSVGTYQFQIKKSGKGKPYAILDWKNLTSAVKALGEEPVARFGSLLASITHNGAEIWRDIRVDEAVKAARFSSGRFLKDWPKHESCPAQTEKGFAALIRWLPNLGDLVVVKHKGKRDTVGFLALLDDDRGVFRFKLITRFEAYLEETSNALNKLEAYKPEALSKEDAKVYEWTLSRFAEANRY